MRKYELIPVDGHKSFYGKAIVIIDDNSETLYSYGVKIMTRTNRGDFVRHWGGWSQTTGRHIKAFSGFNKNQYFNLEEV